jgi:hypothetical protein
MRKFFQIILLLSFFGLVSCKKENTGIQGVQTVIKGHVSDTIRRINISGYKMVLEKTRYNTLIGTSYDEVATAYTDANGDYSITFDYKLDYSGQSYGLFEQYYGTPYYPEYLGTIKIIAGNTNIVNINAWQPVILNLNVQVLNNNTGQLRVRAEFNNNTSLHAEDIYEKNITTTRSLRTRPSSDINIIFWYYTGNIGNPTIHQKTIPYHTPLNDVSLNFIIDCSTF